MAIAVIENDLVDGILDYAATIGAAGDVAGAELDLDIFQSISVQIASGFTGTWIFEVTNDPTGLWLPKTLISSANAAASTGTSGGIWSGDIGARYFRVRFSALTVGTPRVDLVALKVSQSNATPAPSSQAVTLAAAATSIAKAEDAVHTTGDVGVFILGLRAPAVPASPTSAAGDYGAILVDIEGKQIPSLSASPENKWKASLDFIATTDTLLKASAGAGLINYITDLILENTGATVARVTIKDNATRIATFTLAAGQTLPVSFNTPLFGTAATAVNVALGVAGTVSITATGFIGL